MLVAKDAAIAGGQAALRHYRSPDLKVEHKADQTPVTMADAESEAAIIEVIRGVFPSHSIYAEESGRHEGDPNCCWVIDPLDGTRGFTRGGPYWGPLVAFRFEGHVIAGAMGLPVFEDVYWAGRGHGAFKNGARIELPSDRGWEEATLSLGEMPYLLAERYAPAVLRMIRTARHTRGIGDLAGVALVLDGVADVWLEAGVQPWDLGPAQILFEEAGGAFTDFDGRPSIDGGTAVAARPGLHAHALTMLAHRLEA